MSIPLNIFYSKIGILESLVKYLRENLGLNYSEIAHELNRDPRTIWTVYNKAFEKESNPIKVKDTDLTIPLLIFRNRNLTVFENIVVYLHDKNIKYSEIGKILNRDQRNIWITYSRAIKNRK